MSEEKNNRNLWLHVRVNSQELKKINEGFEKTTDAKLSIYVRKIILGKPHIGKVRNQSLDDLINELGKLKMELNAVGNNFNQAVRKLNAVKSDREIRSWLLTWELDRKNFFAVLDSVNAHLGKIADQW